MNEKPVYMIDAAALNKERAASQAKLDRIAQSWRKMATDHDRLKDEVWQIGLELQGSLDGDTISVQGRKSIERLVNLANAWTKKPREEMLVWP